MRTARLSLVLAALSLIFILGVSSTPVRADGLSIAPSDGTPGTTFAVTASGFSANEGIALWVRYPDGQVVSQGNTHADGSGTVTFNVSTDSSYPYGWYLQVVHGQASGRELSGTFSVSAPGGSGNNGPGNTGSGGCQNGSFFATGFTPGESVATWTGRPDGVVSPLPNAKADAAGTVTFPFMPSAGWPTGTYTVVAQGNSSKFQAVNNMDYNGVSVTTLGCASPSSSVAPPPSGGSSSCPGNNFYATGYTPGESVSTWTVRPDGAAVALPSTTADSSGAVTFPLIPQAGWPAGTYAVAAQGNSSKFATSNNLYFDGANVSGGNCAGSSPSSGGNTNTFLGSKNIVNYQGPAVYLNTDPEALYYFDCNWKWRPMGGTIYMLATGFQPNQSVSVSYEILAVQGRTPYGTITADGSGNAQLIVNADAMTKGHYHWWFTSSTASYCGHYDPTP